MGKKVGTANGAKTPWKHKVKEARRLAAEERQKKYDALPIKERLKHCGEKEKAKLLKKAAA